MPVLPTLRQLEYFLALSRRLNFTAAAADCFVTQSTLSAGIKELEAALHARLVERDRQRVMLTPLGVEVRDRAEELVASAADLAAFAAARGKPMAGVVRLGAIPTIAPFVLPELLRAARVAIPELRVLVREGLTDVLLRRLRRGELDFALIALPFVTEGLDVEPLYDEPLWRVGRPAELDSAAPEASDSDRLILLEEGHCLRNHALAACSPTRDSHRSVEASSLFTLMHLVEDGWGWTVLPEMAIHAGLAERAGLAVRPFAVPGPTREIVLVTRPSSARREVFHCLAQLGRTLGAENLCDGVPSNRRPGA